VRNPAVGYRPSAVGQTTMLAAAGCPFPRAGNFEEAGPSLGQDEGAVGVVLLAVAAVTLVVSLAVVAAGQFMIGYAAAEAAADAAALAAAPVTFRPFGATGTPVAEAHLFARANGAELVGCRCSVDESWEPRTVVVTVRRSFPVLLFGERSIEATSWAEFIPTRLLN
jgi:hypothetical protein